MRHETSAKLCTRPSLIVHVKERAHIATMADVVGGIRCLTAVLLSRSTERLATSQARAQRGWALAQQRKRAPKHKSIVFRKHLLRHECESEPGFVCTCKTYHRSRQRCTHLLNTTQYFHFLPSKACRSSKQAKGSAKVARGIYSPQNAAAACLAPIDTTINFRESNIHQKFIGQEEKCAEHQ